MPQLYQSKQTYTYKDHKNVRIIKGEYISEPSAALLLVDGANESEILIASVAVGACTGLERVVIKDYSENSGVKQWLIEQGIIEEAVLNSYPTGFVIVTEHAICMDQFEFLKEVA